MPLKTIEWGQKWMPNEQTRRIDDRIAAEEAAEAAAEEAAEAAAEEEQHG